MQITELSTSDFPEIYTIEKKAHLVPWTYSALLNNQGDNYCNLKILKNQTIIGFVMSHLVLDEANIYNISIDPEHQNRGFGKLLLAELIKRLKIKNIHTIWLEVRESNIKAISLYQSLGFHKISIRKNYYPCTQPRLKENAIIMRCLI